MTLTENETIQLADSTLYHWYRSGSEDINQFNKAVIDFARAIEARVYEELRKQEPVAWAVTFNGEISGNIYSLEHGAKLVFGRLNSKFPQGRRMIQILYAAPIPPTVTPSQEEALNAMAIMCPEIGDETIPTREQILAAEKCIYAFILARPDTEGSKP